MKFIEKPAVAIALATALSLSAPAAHAQNVCGDVDNNGAVTAGDALRVLQRAIGIDVTLLCPGVQGGPFDATDILSGAAFETIFLTYADLARNAETLRVDTDRLANSVTIENLEVAQQSWRDTRLSWEATEGFLFGPVDTQGLDPKLDTWPVNKTDLDNILGSNADLTDPLTILLLDNSVKGFHTIEYLLFDDGSGTPGTDFIGNRDSQSIVDALSADSRRRDYLIGVTADLAANTAQLADAWDPDGDDFATVLASAGKGSNRWLTQKSALQELIEGMAGIADEVANGKISDPFFQSDTKLVESQFSFNSLTDFQSNIESIRNVYEGSNPQGCSADGLSAYIVTVDQPLDTRMRNEIAAAISAIAAIAEPFRDSILDPGQAGAINAAIAATNVLRNTLEGDVFDVVVNEGTFAF